jgi:hypothetical protein
MLVRVAEPGRPGFQLRKGEEGLSVFDLDGVNPPLTDAEVLDSFRPGSQVIGRTQAEVEAKGLQVIPIPGHEPLPQRLRDAHREIRPGSGMTRAQFKQALKELE